MEISSEEWVAESGDEAIVLVKSSLTSVAAFAHPYRNNIGDFLAKPLIPFAVDNIRVAETPIAFALRHGTSTQYDCCTKLVDKALGLCELNGIQLRIEDYIPNDIQLGEFIEFSCNRIDLSR